MKPAPVVDRLYSRHLESRRVSRTYVRECRVLEAEPSHLLMATTAVVAHRVLHDAPPPADHPRAGTLREGRLRVDVLGESVLRVRYAEGDETPANQTPMLVGRPAPPARSDIETRSDSVVYRIANASVEIGLRPFMIRVNDPDGRELCRVGGLDKNYLSAAGAVWDCFNTGLCRTDDGNQPLAVETFALRPREAIYGFGEQFIRLDKVGQTIDLNMVEATGTTTPRSYKNVPFYVSSAGYGVYFNHSARMTCWVGSMSAPDLQIAVEDDFLDYFILLGDVKQVLAGYTELTGAGKVPPQWSFGYWQSKISYQSAEETLDVVRKMREADLPVDVLHLDTFWFREDWRCDLEFDRERFPDPAAYMKEMARLGVKVCLWQLPYIPEGSALFDELQTAGAFVRRPDGSLSDVGINYTPNFDGVVGCIDFTHPAAREIYGTYLRRLFELGASAIKADFGEQAPLDGVYHDGTPGWRMHNLYPLLYNQTVAEVTAEATGEHVIWARSAWAGCQRYPLHWGGDSTGNWDNLIPQIEGGLSLGLSGFQFWSQDIGGFFGQPDGALLIRWLQAGLFLSHARIHGFGDRELYKFDETVVRIGREFLHLRYRLLPYLYGTAFDCVARSLPMARALVVEFQDDPNTWNIGSQWLLGDALLVAPIYDESNRRSVYLPTGAWTDWWSGEVVEGGRWIDVEVPLERMPLWIREGAIVPLGPLISYVGERPAGEITLRIAPFRSDGETRFTLRLDQGPVELVYRASNGAHELRAGAGAPNLALEVVGRDASPVNLVLM